MIVKGSNGETATVCGLTPEELEEFRRLLLEKRRDLLGDLTGMTAEARGAGPGEGFQDGPGPKQQKFADESDDREITMGLLASERTLLQEISEALERIESGTYGVCAATGDPIGKNRLLAKPWAKYCIACARTREQRSRSNGIGSRRRRGGEHFVNGNDEPGREPRDVKAIATADNDE